MTIKIDRWFILGFITGFILGTVILKLIFHFWF